MKIITTPIFELSVLDQERFHVRTVKTALSDESQLKGLLDFSQENQVEFLIARIASDRLDLVQKAEQEGFRLMDTLVHYKRNLRKTPLPDVIRPVQIRSVKSGEEDKVRELAAQAFKDYRGHYFMDFRLNREQCAEVYPSWAYRSCLSKDVAKEVFIAENKSEIIGFATVNVTPQNQGEGALFGVAPHADGGIVYWALMVYAMRYFLKQNIPQMVTSTQITNTVVQKIWGKMGFEPSHAEYTLHKWMNA